MSLFTVPESIQRIHPAFNEIEFGSETIKLAHVDEMDELSQFVITALKTNKIVKTWVLLEITASCKSIHPFCFLYILLDFCL